MDDDWASHWPEGCGVVVEGTMESFPGGEGWRDGCLAQKVERELCLRKEFVPEVVGKGDVDAGEDAEKMCLEGLDSAFGGVGTVDVWRY